MVKPREVVMAPSLPAFKKHFDYALRYLVQLLGCPVWSQAVDSMIFMDPFQLRTFYEVPRIPWVYHRHLCIIVSL